jgi:hypothetical protein
MTDVIWQLKNCFFVPAIGNVFEVLRRKFSLNSVLKREIQHRRFAGFTVPKDGLGFARVVVAVVAEENNFSADLRLEFPGGLDF